MRVMRLAASICFLSLFLLTSCGYKEPMQGQQATLQVACLGDSITYGYKLADPARTSYPVRLSQQSKGLWHVLNLGVNGATVLNKGDIPITAQKSYHQLIKSTPDVVIIMLGTNDIKDNNYQHISNFVRDYITMIEKIQQLPSSPRVIVCSIPPILIDYPNGLNAKRQKSINLLIKKAANISGAEFFDINAQLVNKPSLFIDGIHPNTLGAQKIASLMFQKVSKL